MQARPIRCKRVAFPRTRCSRVAQPTPWPPAPAEAAARRHRSRSSRSEARRAPHCCAEARCAESAVPEGRRRKPDPLASLVAHSPCHRSSRFTGRCSSPSGTSRTRQSPPSCPLARRCQARLVAGSTVSESRQHAPGPLSAPSRGAQPTPRSSRFTGRSSSPSAPIPVIQAPPSCTLLRRSEPRFSISINSRGRRLADSPREWAWAWSHALTRAWARDATRPDPPLFLSFL